MQEALGFLSIKKKIAFLLNFSISNKEFLEILAFKR
jgi:hypothetical protein